MTLLRFILLIPVGELLRSTTGAVLLGLLLLLLGAARRPTISDQVTDGTRMSAGRHRRRPR